MSYIPYLRGARTHCARPARPLPLPPTRCGPLGVHARSGAGGGGGDGVCDGHGRIDAGRADTPAAAARGRRCLGPIHGCVCLHITDLSLCMHMHIHKQRRPAHGGVRGRDHDFQHATTSHLRAPTPSIKPPAPTSSPRRPVLHLRCRFPRGLCCKRRVDTAPGVLRGGGMALGKQPLQHVLCHIPG